MSIEKPMQTGPLASVYVAWGFSLAAVIAIILWIPEPKQLSALGLTLGVTSIVAFVAQLIVAQKSGLVLRLALSLIGAFVIVGAATLTLSVVAAA